MRCTFLLCLTLGLLTSCKKPSSQNGANAAANAGAPAAVPVDYQLKEFGPLQVPVFDHWKIVPVKSDSEGNVLVTSPEGHETQFDMTVMISNPVSAAEVDQLFDRGPLLVQQAAPGLQRTGEPKRMKLDANDAMTEEYAGTVAGGTAVKARVIYVKKGDIAVIVMGRGTDDAFPQYAPKIEVTARGIAVKASPIEPLLAGKWGMTKSVASGVGAGNAYSKSEIITIAADGSFIRESSEFSDRLGLGNEQSRSASGRGTLSRRGNILTFSYTDGRTQNLTYQLAPDGSTLTLGDIRYRRQ